MSTDTPAENPLGLLPDFYERSFAFFRPGRGAIALLVAAAMVVAACADDAGDDSDDSAPGSGDTQAAVVGIRTVTFVDTTRATPRSGDVAGTDERVLETLISYPAVGDASDETVADAEPVLAGGPYPLVVFSHGLGGDPETAQDLVDAWVSAGFVVAAPRFPLSRADAPAGPDGADVGNQPGDVSFVITMLTTGSGDADFPPAGLIDGERVAAAGHSNGGITTLGIAANSCCRDTRLDAAITMAGTPTPYADGEYDWADTPLFLVVHGTDDAQINYAEGVRLFNELRGPKGLLSIEGGDHGSWFDSEVDGHDDVARVTTDFLLAHLRNDNAAAERLATEDTGGPTTLRYVAEAGSTDTITTTTVAGIDRRVTVEPTTDLRDGAVVVVTWEGFTPGGSVNVVQCAAGGVAGAEFCDLTAARILLPNPTGTGSTELEIIVGPVGQGSCGPESTDCVVTVNDSGLTEPDATVRLPLEFAA